MIYHLISLSYNVHTSPKSLELLAFCYYSPNSSYTHYSYYLVSRLLREEYQICRQSHKLSLRFQVSHTTYKTHLDLGLFLYLFSYSNISINLTICQFLLSITFPLFFCGMLSSFACYTIYVAKLP